MAHDILCLKERAQLMGKLGALTCQFPAPAQLCSLKLYLP